MIVRGKIVRSIRLGEGNNLNIVPVAKDVLLPCGNVTSNLVIIGNKVTRTLGLRNIVLVAVVGEHPVGSEVAGHLGDAVLYILNPLCTASAAVIDIIVSGSDLVLDNGVDGGGIKLILKCWSS